jgi:hypothetical protein
MALATATNGYLRMVTTNTFGAAGQFLQPRAVTWYGATGAGVASITDADGVTVCLMCVSAANQQQVLDGHFYGEARPWKLPITATLASGKFLIPV